VILAVLPPVFYSLDMMPDVLRPLAYAVPTTHASLMLQDIMGIPTPADWSLGFGLAIQIAYLLAFITLAKTKALWREN
jgi:ABC-2 type transport system permease protein